MTQIPDPFDPKKLDWSSRLLDGWRYVEPATKYWHGAFIHLYRVARTCKSCGAEITIDVTKKALQGFSQNAGLLMKNCPACRALRKGGGPGSRGGTSRPRVENPPPEQADELETLRTANSTMKAELEGLYGMVRELNERLAKYELPAAMQQMAAEGMAAVRTQFTAEGVKSTHENNVKKMPWDA